MLNRNFSRMVYSIRLFVVQFPFGAREWEGDVVHSRRYGWYTLEMYHNSPLASHQGMVQTSYN